MCERAFLDLKSRLASQPILHSPNYSKQFCLAVDASQDAVGGCLFQISDGVEHPVCYLSRKLNKHEIHYSTIEKEALALVSAVRAWSVYFGNSPVIVFSDLSPLQFINSIVNSNQKLLHWKLELQQYNLEIRHRPGRLNFLPDFLSRPAWVGRDPCWAVFCISGFFLCHPVGEVFLGLCIVSFVLGILYVVCVLRVGMWARL